MTDVSRETSTLETCEVMRDEGWLTRFPGRCYFYPGRDCPGWKAGGMCGRIGDRIPLDVGPED